MDEDSIKEILKKFSYEKDLYIYPDIPKEKLINSKKDILYLRCL